jgi:hypothetical protein
MHVLEHRMISVDITQKDTRVASTIKACDLGPLPFSAVEMVGWQRKFDGFALFGTED